MQQYQNLVRDILENGEEKFNERTGERTLSIPGCHLRFDLREGFPAVTSKKLAFKSALGELVGFLKGATSAKDFRDLGCKVWDQNANENKAWLANPFRQGEDDLGPVYGRQWRRWPAFKVLPAYAQGEKWDEHEAIEKTLLGDGWSRVGDTSRFSNTGNDVKDVWYKEIDQLGDCIRKIISEPTDRRILFHAWNPATLDQVALPACHLLYQFLPNPTTKNLAMNLYIRSWDVFLGAPFNIASAALLLSIVAKLTGYTPTIMNVFGGDTHLYSNHIEQARVQVTREPYPLPQLNIKLIGDGHVGDGRVANGMDYYENMCDVSLGGAGYDKEQVVRMAISQLDTLEPEWFELVGYRHHEPLSAKMAV